MHGLIQTCMKNQSPFSIDWYLFCWPCPGMVQRVGHWVAKAIYSRTQKQWVGRLSGGDSMGFLQEFNSSGGSFMSKSIGLVSCNRGEESSRHMEKDTARTRRHASLDISGFFPHVFFIQGWLNPQIGEAQIWRAHCVPSIPSSQLF